MLIESWSQALSTSFQNLAGGVIAFVPNIIIAIILFVVGWVVGEAVGMWIAKLVQALKVDKVLEKLDLHALMQRAGYRLDSGLFLGTLVKWFIILGFLVAALDVLQLNQVNIFLQQVLGYIPRVIIATVILIIAAVLADVMQKIVVASARAASVSSAELFGGITKWLIWIFAVVTALEQLGVMGPFLQIFMTGIVATITIAIGLSFGLGGKDAAESFINKIRGEISHKN
ncbi:MAG TPA: hypothetical protein P5274_03060 [Candidatus Paceibacterota bacterium]|nr:hypothetical protein [Candidatus Paceibacterota bacterium]